MNSAISESHPPILMGAITTAEDGRMKKEALLHPNFENQTVTSNRDKGFIFSTVGERRWKT